MKNLTVLKGGRYAQLCVFTQKILVLFLTLMASFTAFSQTNTYTGSSGGNWNSSGNWSNGVPTSAHDVVIPNNKNVTVNANAVCKTLTIQDGNKSSIVTINNNISLSVSEAITIGTSSANSNYKRINVQGGTLSAQSISVTAASGSNRAGGILVSTGTVNVTGNIALNNNNVFTFSGAGTLNIGGNLTDGVFTPSTGTVNYNGSGTQEILTNTTSFYNLTITKPTTAALVNSNSAFNVTNNITVTSGTLNLNGTNADYVFSKDLAIEDQGVLSHNVDWDVAAKLIRVSGNLLVDGIFKYSVRSHLQMTTTNGSTRTIRTGNKPQSGLSILTLQTGNFDMSGNLKVEDNLWAMYMTNGTFRTNGHALTASGGMLISGGSFQVNGGSATVSGGLYAGFAGTSGVLNVSSGTLNVDFINVGVGVGGSVTHSGGVVNVVNVNNETTYTCSGNPVINVSGNWNVKNNSGFVVANSTVNFIGAGAHSFGGNATTFNFYNLNVNKPGGSLSLGAGVQTLNVNGNLELTSGTLNTSSATQLNIYGNWTNNAQFTGNTTAVRLLGSSQQSVGGNNAIDVYTLLINNSNNVVLTNNINISGGNNALNLTNGKIVTGSNHIYVTANTTITGANENRYVNGNLRMGIANGNTTRTFNVGDNNYYAPVSLVFSNAGGSGSITVSTTGSEHPNIVTSTLVDNLSTNRYYTISNSGVTFTNYAAVLYFNAAEIDSESNTANYIVGQYNGSWTYPSLGNKNPENIRATSLTTFGTFAVAEGGAAVPSIVTNPSNFSGCAGTSTSISASFTSKLATSVQWQVSTNGGGSYTNISSAPYSIITTQTGSDIQSTLLINPIGAGMNNYRYRAVATNSRGSVNTSHALLTLGTLPVVNAGSALAEICGAATSAPLGGSVSNASGGVWSSDVGGTFTPSANDLNAVWTAPAGFSGNATLTLTNVGGCTQLSASKVQAVKISPNINITPSSFSTCVGAVQEINVMNYNTTTVQSTHSAYSIPNNSATGVKSTLSVAGIPANAVVKSVTVTFTATHPKSADLIVNLQAPNGKILNLVNRNTTGANFTNTSIASYSTTNITSGSAPYSGTYKSNSTLNVGLTGMSSNVSTFESLYSTINGDWILGVRDAAASNSGNLNAWDIQIEWYEPTVWSPITNLFLDANKQTPYTGSNARTVYYDGSVSGTANIVASQTGINGCVSNVTIPVTIHPNPVVTLQKDYCAIPGKVILTANSDIPVTNYLWNTGATTNSITADIAVRYEVVVTTAYGCTGIDSAKLGLELIENGNFEAGNTGFTSAYTYVNSSTANGLNPEERYTVTDNPTHSHSNFWGRDHTSGSGRMMVVNGSGSATPINVWSKTVTVMPNTNYYFSAWAMSMNSVGPYANLQFKVNGVQVGTTTGALPPRAQNNTDPFVWTRFYGTWNSGSATSAVISIIDLETSAGGNDFAIDDISFGTMSPYIELVNAGANNQTICLNASITAITYNVGGERDGPEVTGLPAGVSYVFNGSTIVISGTPTSAGVYNYTIRTTGACAEVIKTGTITVQKSVGGYIAPVSLCGNASGSLSLSGHTGNVIRWETSTNGTTWTNITNSSTTQSYNFTGTKLYYRALVRVGTCATEYSNVATVSLHNYWTGTEDNNWDNPNNWADGILPSSSCAIIHIPVVSTNYPSIYSGTVTIENINVHNGAVLTVDNAVLNITGTITANGNINAQNGTISLSGSSAQQVSGSYFVNNTVANLVLGNSAGLTVTGTDTLKISNEISFSASNVVLNVNNNLTLLSSLENTARVDDLTGGGVYSGNNILGNVTVERYIPKHYKAWQLLSVPTKGNTVKSSWMEGNAPMQNNKPGRGTMVTGQLADAVAQGFDVRTSAGATVKSYNPTTNVFDGLPSAITPLQGMRGYMLMVRGDRSVMTSTAEATSTILRTTGQLYTTGADAPPTVNIAAGKFEAIGNPFPSAIDYNLVNRSGGVANTFYLWDPILTNEGSAFGLGGYQTFTRVGSTYVVTPGGGSYADGNTNIESGQAFMVYAPFSGGSVTITESAKVKGSHMVNRNNGLPEYFRTQLMATNNGNPILLDGVMNVFDVNFTNGVDINDAPKAHNTNENLGIKVDGRLLSVDSRQPFTHNDTVQYNLTQLRVMSYQFVFVPVNTEFQNIQAFLEDLYTNTITPISLSDTTIYQFNVVNIAGSYAPNRFRLVFKNMDILPVTFTSISANPTRNNDIDVVWKVEEEVNMDHYELERSTDGRTFNFIAQYNPNSNGGRATYYHTDIKPGNGVWYYRVKGISSNGMVQYSPIARASLTILETGIEVYPVPVENKTIMVHFNNAQRDRYQVEVVNAAGVVIHRGIIDNSTSNQVIPIYLNKAPRGVYILRMKGKTYFEKKLIVN